MEKEKVFGWLLMLVGIANIFVTTILIKNTETTIGTILGLIMIIGIVVPCIMVGSILSETAPRFIMDRYSE